MTNNGLMIADFKADYYKFLTRETTSYNLNDNQRNMTVTPDGKYLWQNVSMDGSGKKSLIFKFGDEFNISRDIPVLVKEVEDDGNQYPMIINDMIVD